ncbi:MAG: peptidoglycan editing factor PgeF [Spirochaetaceae bacterium]|jgi:YfiH family protein|nr:peptidoglycan editing factor PgeF [Spirochaetaceae bacterium]
MNNSDSYNLYPFKAGHGVKKYAVFSFVYDGRPLDRISCVITLRGAGDMRHEAARKKVFCELGATDKKIFYGEQTHSRNVAVVTKNDSAPLPDTDGLVTTDFDTGLYVTTADCLSVFLYDVAGGAFAALHSGWKGTGIAANALRLMIKTFGAKPKNIAAVLGPCIRACCYNVDEERAALYEKEFGGAEDGAAFPLGPVVKKKETASGTEHYIDMQAANAALLVKNNVRNIAYCTDCTFTDERFGSYRRQGAQNFTKMMALAVHLDNPGGNHA